MHAEIKCILIYFSRCNLSKINYILNYFLFTYAVQKYQPLLTVQAYYTTFIYTHPEYIYIYIRCWIWVIPYTALNLVSHFIIYFYDKVIYFSLICTVIGRTIFARDNSCTFVYFTF